MSTDPRAAKPLLRALGFATFLHLPTPAGGAAETMTSEE
jgi:hypothetical protein